MKKIEDKEYSKMINYSIYNPISGNKLNFNDICSNESVILQENLMPKLINTNLDINYLKHLAEQNIDIFDLTSDFYTDICYEFDSPLPGSKDIPLKDRVKLFFPNITLCENNCQITGINLTTFQSICDCKLNNIFNTDFLGNNLFLKNELEEIQNLFKATNIEVLKCYKSIFIYKYFISCTGGFLIIVLILIQIVLTIIYYYSCFFKIQKYIFNISEKYILYLFNQVNNIIPSNNNLKEKQNNKEPPKKRSIIKDVKSEINNNDIKEKNVETYIIKKRRKKKRYSSNLLNINYQNISNGDINSKNNQLSISNNSNIINYSTTKNIQNNFSNNMKIKQYEFSESSNIQGSFLLNMKNTIDVNIEEYLSTEPDDMDYDDALKKDKRKISEIFINKLKNKQILMNTFFAKDPLKPRPIKILLFLLDIDLYFFINGLFFTEEFISKYLHIDKNQLLSFVERLKERFLYIALFGIIINYIIDCFFIEEKKIKGIFRREKESLVILKYEISKTINIIKNRFNLFIIVSFVITIFTLFYILCFNIVYPSMKNEWIKTSIIIIVIIQILSLLECFLESLIRIISFKCKSEKLYKISYLLS